MGIMGGGGKSCFVDPANGATGNSGLKQNEALASVGAAYALTTDKQGDVIYYLNDGNTTGSSREATIPLVWSNDNTHLVGCLRSCSDVAASQDYSGFNCGLDCPAGAKCYWTRKQLFQPPDRSLGRRHQRHCCSWCRRYRQPQLLL